MSDDRPVERRTFRVGLMTRVEGEGRFDVTLREGQVAEAHLSLFEAPRYFEALVRGRSLYEVPDLVARICGICPVAYQMSAARALERALGVVPDEAIRTLRRLLYCGEWIESHALHVFMLHAPDLLGFPSAIELSRVQRDVVERGLTIKRAGNALVELLGGRAIHPVSPRIGGFSKVPTPEGLAAIAPMLRVALAEAIDAVAWTARLCFPTLHVDYVFVALASDAYPLEEGEGVLIGRPSGTTEHVAFDDFDHHFVESQVPHSNALQCRLRDGTPYLCGPSARLFHHFDKLHPRAREAARAAGLSALVDNPHRTIIARAVEIVHALATALDIVASYVPPSVPFVTASVPGPCVGAAATEAPRGLLWHRYRVASDGTVAEAQIVPPTSQNQARIEADLVALAPSLVALDQAEATARCERLIRCYDPCISCATHFLRLSLRQEQEPR